MPFPPSAACRFFDLPPVNLQYLPLHLTKNSFASAPTHLCGIVLGKAEGAAEAPAEMAGAFRLGCCTEGMGYLFGIMDSRRTDGGCGGGLREFRASADARVPFPQGKGTKGCRGPARIPCGAPAPGPPSCKRLVSVEPRGGVPDGVPFGSARTAPLKTFRFQRRACA